MTKEYIELKATSITRSQLYEVYSSIEKQLNIKLTIKGKTAIRRDVNHYLLYNNNDINRTLEYFKNYKESLKKLYLGYSDEALDNIISHLYR